MITIRVPATSANLGVGFDSLGLALEKYNTFHVSYGPSLLAVTGNDWQGSAMEHLCVTSYDHARKQLGLDFALARLDVASEIPMARGLGSSATCVVAGVAIALWQRNQNVDLTELLTLCLEIEAHPDNLAAAIFGGFTNAVSHKDGVLVQALPYHPALVFTLCIPKIQSKTEQARALLPKTCDYPTMVHNLSRIPLLLSGIQHNQNDWIALALDDRLHEPYRVPLIPGFQALKAAALQHGYYGVYLSGAGPTMMCIGDGKETAMDPTQFPDWAFEPIAIADKGVEIDVQ
ncbi:MAG: homoserine kinase [Erysipelotrichaceae bacterium]